MSNSAPTPQPTLSKFSSGKQSDFFCPIQKHEMPEHPKIFFSLGFTLLLLPILLATMAREFLKTTNNLNFVVPSGHGIVQAALLSSPPSPCSVPSRDH